MRVALDGTPRENAAELTDLLAEASPCEVQLPPGEHAVEGGFVLREGWRLRGAPTTLRQVDATDQPFVHVLGSDTAVSDVTLAVPQSHPGPHDGDKGTAITVGRYLYPEPPRWLEDVTIRDVHVVRAGRCPANSIAIMGAVRRLDLAGVHVSGGGTGVAVHWGATGLGVADLTGYSYHPHLLTIRDLHVSDAYEGFYLSSVHDVEVEHCRMHDVEIGFRLLPGDNTDRFHDDAGDSPVSSRISVTDCEIGWNGDLYALRVAGWGRSEVDQLVSQLDYRDLTISDVVVHPLPQLTATNAEGRAAVVVENAGSVAFERLRLAGSTGVVPVRIDGRDLPLSALTGAT